MHGHLVRQALIAAGQPAWPEAIELLETRGGSYDTRRGRLVLAPVDVEVDGCAVGRLGEHVVWLDAGGGLHAGDVDLGPVDEALDALIG